MYSTVRTAVLDGISAIPVQVEVDISTGMPVFDMVGNLTSEVREAKERVKTALHSLGIENAYGYGTETFGMAYGFNELYRKQLTVCRQKG